MACYNIMAVVVNHRSKNAMQMQEIMTKHGCAIKMRLGLHEAGDVCSEEGLIILQLAGSDEEVNGLENELNSLAGVNASTIKICSDPFPDC